MARIRTRRLVELCHRVATATKSGVDIRRIWEIESRQGPAAQQAAASEILRRISGGDPLAVAMRDTRFFPPLVVEMTDVGERTGKLDEVLFRLGEHYDHGLKMRQTFLIGIAWPVLELAISVLVIGGVIYITGVINDQPGAPGVDILGLGLTGASGALIWFLAVAFLAGSLLLAILALAKGWLGSGPTKLAMQLPLVGGALESLALSRLTWAFALALESGMSAKRSVELAMRASQNGYYEDKTSTVVDGVVKGREFHESFREAGVFPNDFLTALESAEVAGATSESLLLLARTYEDKARMAIRVLTGIATFLTVAVIFGVIIFAIFRVFMFYINTINSALEGV